MTAPESVKALPSIRSGMGHTLGHWDRDYRYLPLSNKQRKQGNNVLGKQMNKKQTQMRKERAQK